MASQSKSLALCRNEAGVSFQNDTQGTVAIIFTFFLVIVLGLVGGAVDFGTAYRQREALYTAADSASLSVVATGSDAYKLASGMTQDGPVPSAETVAVNNFTNEIARQDNGITLIDVRANVVKAGQTVTATVSFKASVPAHFLGMFGLNSLTVDGHATSVNGTPAYIDFYLLLDNSPSMGIAATSADIETMVNSTPDKCAFACHDQSKPNNYYNLAHNLGVTTRIDVLRQATQKLMDTAAATASVPNQFQMSIDTFNLTTQPISALSTDLAAAKANANAIDLMPIPFQGWNNDRTTDLSVALADMTAKVPASGSGVTSNDTQKVVFLVTDGVSDEVLSTANSIVAGANSQPGGDRLIQAADPDQCSVMKSRGIKVAVIYTSYLPLPTNRYYNDNVAPWQDQINPKLKACATPGYFFEVKPNQGIDEAMRTLFLKAVAEAKMIS